MTYEIDLFSIYFQKNNCLFFIGKFLTRRCVWAVEATKKLKPLMCAVPPKIADYDGNTIVRCV